MFKLKITHPLAPVATSHPSREVALGRLEQFLQSTGHHARVVTATWTDANYEILGGSGHVVGHAAIDEICGCSHAAREHNDMGCTAISLDTGPFAECNCDGHQPANTEADLFAAEVPT